MSNSKASSVSLRPSGSRRHHQVTMIELSTKYESVRRSKIGFWAVGGTVALTTAVIASAITHPVKAIGLGVLAGAIGGFIAAFALFVWPAVRVAWHWSAELLTLGAFLTAYLLLVELVPWWLTLTILALAVGAPMLVPRLRRFLVALVMCAVSRHRLRVCFCAFVAAQRTGHTPLILLARPIPAGERVDLASARPRPGRLGIPAGQAGGRLLGRRVPHQPGIAALFGVAAFGHRPPQSARDEGGLTIAGPGPGHHRTSCG